MAVEFAEAPPVDLDLYWYEAHLVSFYDADTLTLDIDLGFGVWLKSQKVRLYRIDAWEIRGSEKKMGKAAKDFVQRAFDHAARVNGEGAVVTPLYIRTHKDRKGKYGRWLAEVFVEQPYFVDRGGGIHPYHEKSNFVRWVNLNKALVEAGHAEIME
jgi:micrococcal nuclease